ncbi:MAG: hypothetical protein SFX19_08725 [Alphaproteobacteria bacterium]|nr:hypothetical protein [Alphaproteobacteria bacterium]
MATNLNPDITGIEELKYQTGLDGPEILLVIREITRRQAEYMDLVYKNLFPKTTHLKAFSSFDDGPSRDVLGPPSHFRGVFHSGDDVTRFVNALQMQKPMNGDIYDTGELALIDRLYASLGGPIVFTNPRQIAMQIKIASEAFNPLQSSKQ